MKNHPVNPVNPVKIFIRNIPENRQIPNVFKSSHESKDTTETSDSDWKSLYRVGGVAAMIAGVIFRRNLGPEISLFSAQKQPDTIIDWFTLLQNNRLLCHATEQYLQQENRLRRNPGKCNRTGRFLVLCIFCLDNRPPPLNH